MMQRRFLAALGMSLGMFLVGALSAQESVDQNYDVSNPITLKGSFAGLGLLPGSPHGYLFVDVTDAGGNAQIWAVEGDSPAAFAKAGWRLGPGGPVSLGDAITVLAFRPKPNAKVMDTVPANATRTIEAAKAGRLVRGAHVTLSDGKKLTFGESR